MIKGNNIRTFNIPEIKKNAVAFDQIPLKKENLELLTCKLIDWGYFCDDPDHPEEPNWAVNPPKTLKEFKEWVKTIEYRTKEDSITLYKNTLLGFVIDEY